MIVEFRAKRTDKNVWVYGGLAYYRILDEYVIIDDLGFSHEVQQDTIGQFLGLFDNDDTPMFTGDIITHDGFYHPAHPECHMLIPSIFDIFNDNWNYDIESLRSKDCIKVVGNIYENPELMEGK